VEKKAIPNANQRDAYDQMHCHDMHRPAERAQTKMGETEAGTHRLFPSASPSRKPPPVSEFVFGALSAPKTRGNGSGHSRPVSVRADVPKATARVSIGFRRAERAQKMQFSSKIVLGRAQGAQIKLRLNERGNITETVRSGTSGAHYRLSRRRRAS
jgi:hypothetical protein